MIKDVHINSPKFLFGWVEFEDRHRFKSVRRPLGAADSGMLAIASFIIHYPAWQG
jgi:hypothetical protein